METIETMETTGAKGAVETTAAKKTTETPVCDFVKRYAGKNPLRLHMPGHKGKSCAGAEPYDAPHDITEIDGADVLYHPEGIIKESEEIAASLFGSGKTVYSAEGSSLCIRAMLYLALIWGRSVGRKPIVAAGRNAHKTFMTAAALLDFQVKWLYSEPCSLISCDITPEQLDKALTEMGEKPSAVYITGPDYLGNLPDIEALSKVCRRHEVLLLVDNAHGAYLNFLPESRHPISLGADLCCDSAHKTLPVLTGGAYLHISKAAPEILSSHAESAMSVFASTSPSYLIIESLDMANRYLSEGYREKLARSAEKIAELKKHLTDYGYAIVGQEPLKLTVAAKSMGYTGAELSEILAKDNIVCEFADPDYCVMMLTPEIAPEEIIRLERSLCSAEKKAPILAKPPEIPRLKSVMTPREAMLSPSEEIPAEDCAGRILADPGVTCPPAIPIAVCGDMLDSAAAECFGYYGIKSCRAVIE